MRQLWRAGLFLRLSLACLSVPLMAPVVLAQGTASADALLKAGKTAFRNKQYDEAAKLFQQAYAKDKELTTALYNRALALRKAGRKAASREAYARYHQAVPGDADGTFGLAEAERLVGRDDEALALFEQYLSQEKRSNKTKYQKFAQEKIKILQAKKVVAADASSKGRTAEEALEEGTRAYREQRFDQAAAAFGEAYAKDPRNTDALYRQALSFRKKGRLVEAVGAYQKLRMKAPKHLDALFGLAETHRLQGDKKKQALREFQSYLRLEKRAGKDRFRSYAEQQVAALSGEIAEGSGAVANRGKEAKTAPSKSAQNRDRAIASFKEGNDAYGEKKYDEAVILFQKAIRADPQRADALYRLALSLRKAKRYAEAKLSYERYTRMVPHDLDGLFGLAETERLMGNDVEAAGLFRRYLIEEKRAGKERFREYAREQVKELQKNAQASPSPVSSNRGAAEAEMEKGKTLYKKGRFREAALHFRAAFDHDRSLQDARLKEALSHRKASQYKDAIRTYAEIRKEDPSQLDALFGLAESHRLQGNERKSRALFSAYIAAENRADRKSYVDYAKTKLANAPKNDVTPASSNSNLVSVLQTAKAHYRAHRYLQAAEAYAKAMLLDGADESIALRHALSLRKAGKLDEAVMAYSGLLDREALALDARFGLAETRRLQGNVVEARRHYEAYVEGEARPERESYVKWAKDKLAELPTPAKKTDSDAPASEHFSAGVRAYRERRFGDAASAFSRAAVKDPQMLDAHYRAALSLRRARRYEDAKRAYVAFLELKKDDPDALYGLAETERLLGNRGAAKRFFSRYIVKESRPSEERYVERARAIVEGRTGTPKGLGLAHRPALGQAKAVRAWIETGETSLQKGEAYSAKGQFALALSRQPKNVRARLGQAKALWLSGQVSAANVEFSAIAADHAGTEAARQAKKWLKRTPKTERRRKANAREKDRARALFFRAQQELQADAKGEARQTLEDGLAMDPTAYLPTLLLGDLLLSTGNAGAALLKYQRAAFLKPTGASALAAQARAYERLGEVGAARKFYERFVASKAPDADVKEQEKAKLWLEGFDARQPWVRR
ncbi:MAG: tetratricopeptide repeat protein [Deltaproteobacteria bacterium]|nr:tetratricopeptide repeat protein [Deltaproteobacteria bacterium]